MGLVSVSDIAREVIAPNLSPERVNVYEIMSKPALTLPPDMLARYAVRLLVRFGISRAVVVDRDRSPVGIVALARPRNGACIRVMTPRPVSCGELQKLGSIRLRRPSVDPCNADARAQSGLCGVSGFAAQKSSGIDN